MSGYATKRKSHGADQVEFRSSTFEDAERIEARLPGTAAAIGRVDLSFTTDFARLSNLRVANGYRQKGIGSSLVQRAVRAADARGLPVVLEASPSPDGISAAVLQAMYRKLGFHDAGFSRAGVMQMRRGLVPERRGGTPPNPLFAVQRKSIRPGFSAGALPQRGPRTMDSAPAPYRPFAAVQQKAAPRSAAPPVYQPRGNKLVWSQYRVAPRADVERPAKDVQCRATGIPASADAPGYCSASRTQGDPDAHAGTSQYPAHGEPLQHNVHSHAYEA